MPDGESNAVPTLVPGRACGSCTLCCKVLGIAELQKPKGQWCLHCSPGRGCRIYDDRPAGCRSFHCSWRLQPELGPEWKPDRSKIVLCDEDGGIAAYVDPGFPSAWRSSPYLGALKALSAQALALGRRAVIVVIGRRMIVLLPDKEVDLGEVGKNQQVRIERRQHGFHACLVDAPATGGNPAPGADRH